MFNTFFKQIVLLVGHTFMNCFIFVFLYILIGFSDGEYGMSPFLLLIDSLILFGIYLLWTIVYFLVKRKILDTSRIIIFYYCISSCNNHFTNWQFFDIINLIFVLSVFVSSSIIYFLNKVLNVENFNKLIS